MAVTKEELERIMSTSRGGVVKLSDAEYQNYLKEAGAGSGLDHTMDRSARPAPMAFDPKAFGNTVAKSAVATTPEGQAPAVHARGMVEYGWGKDWYTPKDEVKGAGAYLPPPTYMTPSSASVQPTMPAAPMGDGTVRGIPHSTYVQQVQAAPKNLAPVVIVTPKMESGFSPVPSEAVTPGAPINSSVIGAEIHNVPSGFKGDTVVGPDSIDWEEQGVFSTPMAGSPDFLGDPKKKQQLASSKPKSDKK
jgi:hypothetical protein